MPPESLFIIRSENKSKEVRKDISISIIVFRNIRASDMDFFSGRRIRIPADTSISVLVEFADCPQFFLGAVASIHWPPLINLLFINLVPLQSLLMKTFQFYKSQKMCQNIASSIT